MGDKSQNENFFYNFFHKVLGISRTFIVSSIPGSIVSGKFSPAMKFSLLRDRICIKKKLNDAVLIEKDIIRPSFKTKSGVKPIMG